MQESRKCNVALWDDLWETQTFYFTKFYFTELFQTNTDTLGQKKEVMIMILMTLTLFSRLLYYKKF